MSKISSQNEFTEADEKQILEDTHSEIFGLCKQEIYDIIEERLLEEELRQKIYEIISETLNKSKQSTLETQEMHQYAEMQQSFEVEIEKKMKNTTPDNTYNHVMMDTS